ncbi:hypothetical protein INT45_002312, partial [Circinella minor]
MNVGDNNLEALGRRVILPLSFIGSPRHIQQLYQDAMSIVRRFGKPDLFVTFTCNLNWPEIQISLLLGQRAPDRPDLTTRVFRLKLKQLMNDLTKDMVLGRVIGHVHTVEFQKRGLPHAHILLILATEDKPITSADCDNIVSAQLPNAEQYPDAQATVERHMMHGPCGLLNHRSPYIVDGRCSKRYPKKFHEETEINEDGYPVYRRPNNRDYVVKPGNVRLDNRWVVPHNVYLCTKYDAHINVEICTSIHSIKYVYKYVYKGHDRASARVVQQGANSDDDQTSDEISTFLDARYVSASEGCWRLFSFSLHHEYPAHRRLAIHLQDEQLVYFNEGETATDVIQGRAHETTLTAWFEYNRQHPNDTALQNTLYINFPEDYVFVDRTRSWKIQERGHGRTIGRIYAVSPREVEKYHLRLLLYHVPGGKSFADMHTIDRGTQNAEILPTFQAAARRRRGLITGQQEWNDCLNQANTYQQPYALCRLIAVILVFCHPDNPYNLWLSHRDSMTEDYLHTACQEQNDQSIQFSDFLYNQALLDTESVMINLFRSLHDFDGFVLQEVVNEHNAADNNEPAIIREHHRLAAQLALQPEQQFRGTGKTYLFNAILEHVRRAGHIALAVATSGTAALLLD